MHLTQFYFAAFFAILPEVFSDLVSRDLDAQDNLFTPETPELGLAADNSDFLVPVDGETTGSINEATDIGHSTGLDSLIFATNPDESSSLIDTTLPFLLDDDTSISNNPCLNPARRRDLSDEEMLLGISSTIHYQQLLHFLFVS